MIAITIFQPVNNMGASSDEENLAIAEKFKTEFERLFSEFSEGEWTADVRLLHNYEGVPPLPVISQELPYDDQILIMETLDEMQDQAFGDALSN